MEDKDSTSNQSQSSGREVRLPSITGIHGIDDSKESMAMAMRTKKQWINIARVEVLEGSVSRLPFRTAPLIYITTVERTHFWWPALPTDLLEVLRVLKPGGRLIIIAEVYKGSEAFSPKSCGEILSKNRYGFLSIEEHRELFTNAGYSDVQVITGSNKGWICCIGSKPRFVRLPSQLRASVRR